MYRQYITQMAGRKLKSACKKRTLSKCKSAKKSCTYAKGTQRKFCRTRKNKKN